MDRLETAIEEKTKSIRLAMSALGRRLEEGDESELLCWVITNSLACAHRPLRWHRLYGGSGNNLAPEATLLVFEWAKRIRQDGIRSIISLMHDRDIGYYQALNLRAADLIGFYKQEGFRVSHIPWEDPHHKKSSTTEKGKMLLKIREKALMAYIKLPKPVLLQCSAGIDRSSPVAAYLYFKSDGPNLP